MVDFHGELVLLLHWSLVNYAAVAKILKKHDKMTGSRLRAPLLASLLHQVRVCGCCVIVADGWDAARAGCLGRRVLWGLRCVRPALPNWRLAPTRRLLLLPRAAPAFAPAAALPVH
jgi:hypothetical protein